MQLKEGTGVFTAQGEEIGKINRIVLNPVSKEVTHIVVQKGLLFPEDKVVPVEWIESADADRVTLSLNSADVQNLPPFEEVYYVSLDEAERRRLANLPHGYTPAYYWYPPYGLPAYPFTAVIPPNVAMETERNIPSNTVPLKEGADVISAEGEHVGDVERVFTDPDSNMATHFLISQGLLLKERKLVPANWISSIEEEKVHLAVGEKLIEQLPAYQS